jgi:hypothetical protein
MPLFLAYSFLAHSEARHPPDGGTSPAGIVEAEVHLGGVCSDGAEKLSMAGGESMHRGWSARPVRPISEMCIRWNASCSAGDAAEERDE